MARKQWKAALTQAHYMRTTKSTAQVVPERIATLGQGGRDMASLPTHIVSRKYQIDRYPLTRCNTEEDLSRTFTACAKR